MPTLKRLTRPWQSMHQPKFCQKIDMFVEVEVSLAIYSYTRLHFSENPVLFRFCISWPNVTMPFRSARSVSIWLKEWLRADAKYPKVKLKIYFKQNKIIITQRFLFNPGIVLIWTSFSLWVLTVTGGGTTFSCATNYLNAITIDWKEYFIRILC